MIIKKIAKMCRKQGTILSLYKNNTLWVGTNAAVYALNGLPYMSGEQIAVSFDFSEKVKKNTYYADGEVYDLPIGQESSWDLEVAEPERTVVNGEDVRIFRHDEKIIFCAEDYFEPLQDLSEDVGLRYALREWKGTTLVAVRSGLILVALILPMSICPETLKKWCDQQRKLILDIEGYSVQIAEELERRERENADDGQYTMEEDEE